MKVYCVKEKRFTGNVPGTEKVKMTKNRRKYLQVKCASCGITKNRFISDQEGKGLLGTLWNTLKGIF